MLLVLQMTLPAYLLRKKPMEIQCFTKCPVILLAFHTKNLIVVIVRKLV